MTAGKAASQAGHAFLDSFLNANKAPFRDPHWDHVHDYLGPKGGTKVVLGVDSEARLHEIYNNAIKLGLPASLIEDDGIATAAGIGPAPRHLIRPLTRRLELMK